MDYLVRLSHLKFSKEGDWLVVDSERDDFETRFEWPPSWSRNDGDLKSKVHENFYTRALSEYEEHRKI